MRPSAVRRSALARSPRRDPHHRDRRRDAITARSHFEGAIVGAHATLAIPVATRHSFGRLVSAARPTIAFAQFRAWAWQPSAVRPGVPSVGAAYARRGSGGSPGQLRFRRGAGLGRQSGRNPSSPNRAPQCLQRSCKHSGRGEARRDLELVLPLDGTRGRPRRSRVAALPLEQPPRIRPELIWRAVCQGGRHEFLAFATGVSKGCVVGWVGGGPACCARRGSD